jgi:hypothetical protein
MKRIRITREVLSALCAKIIRGFDPLLRKQEVRRQGSDCRQNFEDAFVSGVVMHLLELECVTWSNNDKVYVAVEEDVLPRCSNGKNLRTAAALLGGTANAYAIVDTAATAVICDATLISMSRSSVFSNIVADFVMDLASGGSNSSTVLSCENISIRAEKALERVGIRLPKDDAAPSLIENARAVAAITTRGPELS